MLRILSIIFVAALIGIPSTVYADEASTPGEDEIRLKDGGMLRGTVVTVEPGKEAIIIVRGKERTIPWSNIEKVEQGKYQTDAVNDTEKPKNSKKSNDDAEELSEPKRGAPLVHIAGTYPNIQLFQITSSISVIGTGGAAMGMVTRSVCPAPCDQIVDGRSGAQFFFSAPSMMPSEPFSLAGYSGEVEARVQGGSTGKRLGGLALVTVGMTALITGAIFIPLAPVFADADAGEKPNYTPWVATAAGGALVLAGGIVMMATSKTTFEIRPRTSESAGIRIENGVLRF